jgi:hypothetical protein
LIAKKESETTAMRFLPILRKRLFKLVNVEDAIKNLKDQSLPREAKLAHWESVKVLGMCVLH